MATLKEKLVGAYLKESSKYGKAPASSKAGIKLDNAPKKKSNKKRNGKYAA